MPRGRPKLDPKDRRSTPIQFRVTEAERETLELAAKRQGMTLSAWIRWICLEATEARPLEASD